MPDQITVSEFVAETNEDYKAPTASNFTTRMSHCRNTVTALEEVRLEQTLHCPHSVASPIDPRLITTSQATTSLQTAMQKHNNCLTGEALS